MFCEGFILYYPYGRSVSQNLRVSHNMPTRFLTTAQRTRFARLPQSPSEDDLVKAFTLDGADLSDIRNLRTAKNRLGYAALLTGARYVGAHSPRLNMTFRRSSQPICAPSFPSTHRFLWRPISARPRPLSGIFAPSVNAMGSSTMPTPQIDTLRRRELNRCHFGDVLGHPSLNHDSLLSESGD